MTTPIVRLTTGRRLGLLALLGLLSGPAWGAVSCPQPLAEGTPPVRAQHIFCGEINNAGKAVGFHSRPGGTNPASVSDTDETRPDPRRPGIYSISLFRITEGGRSGIKTLSTMFPDKCSQADVLAAIRHAYETGEKGGDGSFRGLSGPRCTDGAGKPFRILGFTATGRGGRVVISTAYPN